MHTHTQIHTHPLSDVVRRNSYFFVYEQYFTGKHSCLRLRTLQLIFPLGLSGEFSKRPVWFIMPYFLIQRWMGACTVNQNHREQLFPTTHCFQLRWIWVFWEDKAELYFIKGCQKKLRPHSKDCVTHLLFFPNRSPHSSLPFHLRR